MISRSLLALLLSFCFAAAAKAGPKDWKDADLGNRIVAGVATAETLWLLGSSGHVVAFDRRDGARRLVEGRVRDLFRDDGRLLALRQHKAGGPARIEDLRGGQVRRTPPLPGVAYRLFAGPTGVGILTTTAVAVPSRQGWRLVRLRPDAEGRLPLAGRVTSALAVDGRLLVGFDHGEWGGGVRALDLSTGAVSIVEHLGDGGLCKGLLNPKCDPVHGIIPDRQRSDCALAATGLAHLGLNEGRIVRICGQTISQVYEPARHPEDRAPNVLTGSGWALSGLIAIEGGWAAPAGNDRIFIGLGPVGEVRPTPVLRDWSGLRVNDDHPRFVAVMNACCWGLASNPTDYGVLLIPVGP